MIFYFFVFLLFFLNKYKKYPTSNFLVKYEIRKKEQKETKTFYLLFLWKFQVKISIMFVLLIIKISKVFFFIKR